MGFIVCNRAPGRLESVGRLRLYPSRAPNASATCRWRETDKNHPVVAFTHLRVGGLADLSQICDI